MKKASLKKPTEPEEVDAQAMTPNRSSEQLKDFQEVELQRGGTQSVIDP